LFQELKLTKFDPRDLALHLPERKRKRERERHTQHLFQELNLTWPNSSDATWLCACQRKPNCIHTRLSET